MNSNFERKRQHLQSLENGGGIIHILNEGYKILENPMVLFDTSYNMLACVEDVITDDRLWNEITALGTFSHETVDFFNGESFIEALAQVDTVALMKSDKLKYDRMNGKLFDRDDVQLGNICVVACIKPFEEGDSELIEIFCEILSVELQNSDLYQKIDRVYQESLLNDLIEGTIKGNGFAKADIVELYHGLKANLYLAVVDVTCYERTVTHLAYFRDLFKKIQAEYRYYIHLNNIVVIISTDAATLHIKKDLNELNEFFKKYKIYAGVSSGFQDLLELQQRYCEAISALNYGMRGMRTRQIFRYDNIRVEHFLNTVKSTAEISKIYSPVIFLILDYDKENNTSLLKLLYMYLLYGKDARLTCAKMKITRHSLKLQLAKLEDFFGIEWKNGDMLSNIFISIKMLDNLLNCADSNASIGKNSGAEN